MQYPEIVTTAAAIASNGASKRSSKDVSRRSQSERTRPTTNTTPTENDQKTESSSAYNRNYAHYLSQQGIYYPFYDHGDGSIHRPSNFSEVQRRLKELRASLLPSRITEEQHYGFCVRNSTASESMVERNIMPAIMGDHNRLGDGGVPWKNMGSMTDETTITPKPDYFEGSRPGDIDLSIRNDSDLRRYIAPTTDRSKVVLSNFSGEHKDQSGSSIVAERQVMTDIAYGTRAMDAIETMVWKLLCTMKLQGLFGYTYHNTTIRKLYCGQSTMSKAMGREQDYHKTRLRSISMEDSVESYIEGASVLRNAADLGKELRDQAVQEANARAR